MQELDENVQFYVSESNELLEELEAALLNLEEKNDNEVLNLIFRAVHTIKGSAGLFGFDHIIQFTHIVENILDDMRNEILPLSSELITILMRSKDHISTLIDALPSETDFDAGEEQDILAILRTFQQETIEDDEILDLRFTESSTSDKNSTDDTSHQQSTIGLVDGNKKALAEHFHISLRLGKATFQQGFNPIAMFKQLSNIGIIKASSLITDEIEVLDNIDSEGCYLGWEISLETDVDAALISEVYEFVDDVGFIILPPKSSFSAYRELIAKRSEENEQSFAQLLVKMGSLTEEELPQILSIPYPYVEETAIDDFKKDLSKQLINEANQPLEPDVKIPETKTKINQPISFVKVDSKKLDKLVNLVGELVINGAKIEQISSQLKNDELSESLESLTLSLDELRETALGMRMIPIGSSFNRFHRVVRDVSKDLNKEIQLEINGSETELDKSVIEKIADPLMHLVRNSLDHGIESTEVRIAAGKSSEGHITLNARHSSGMIVIEISDDGKGLDADVLIEKAMQKGIIKERKELTQAEAFNLIFEAGLTTADSVSNISGRGVGMDVVRRNIEALRGTIELHSEKGVGTTITIQLPLTLAIIDGFHVKVSQEDFILPLDMIKECVTLSETQIEETALHDYITLRDEVLPLIKLTDYFSIQREEKRKSIGSITEDVMADEIDLAGFNMIRKKRKINLVVVQFGQGKVGLVVDSLYGETEAVIKPLGRVFKGLKGFAGFTILGTGLIALVIDVPSLINDVVVNQKKQFIQSENLSQHPQQLH